VDEGVGSGGKGVEEGGGKGGKGGGGREWWEGSGGEGEGVVMRDLVAVCRWLGWCWVPLLFVVGACGPLLLFFFGARIVAFSVGVHHCCFLLACVDALGGAVPLLLFVVGVPRVVCCCVVGCAGPPLAFVGGWWAIVAVYGWS
jgi:hypothetical protein